MPGLPEGLTRWYRLETEYQRTKSATPKQELKHAKRLFNKIRLQSRADHLKNELPNNSANPRLLWRNLNNILHSNESHNYTPNECRQMSSQFGTFFKEKIDKFRSPISLTFFQAVPPPLDLASITPQRWALSDVWHLTKWGNWSPHYLTNPAHSTWYQSQSLSVSPSSSLL